MTKVFISILSLFLWTMTPAFAQTSGQISVTGEGRVAVVPDMAQITLGVERQAKTAAQAMDDMSVAMAAVMDQMTAAGIDPKHVQTGGLRLDQRYADYNTGLREPIGYIAFSDIRVQVFDLARLGSVFDAAVRDGANQMNGLVFDVADRAPHLIAARQAAVADARAKAEVFATAADVTLGNIKMMSEGGRSAAPVPMMARMEMQSDMVPVAAGEISIDATISMVWELK